MQDEQPSTQKPSTSDEPASPPPEASGPATTSSSSSPDAPAKPAGSTGTGQRRRRGKRGGRRHRPAGSGGGGAGSGGAGSSGGGSSGGRQQGATSEKPEAAGDGASKVGARPSRPRQPRTPRPEPTATEGGEPAKSDAPAAADNDGATGDAATGDAATGNAATGTKPRRRRRRGGSKTSGANTTDKQAADGATDEAPADGEAKPEERKALSSSQLAAAGATRLAARKLREEQRKQRGRGRRPRRLTDADAQKLKGKPKTMLIHEHDERTQIAILEDGDLIEHYVSRRGQRGTMVGNVYLGKVQNVIVGMEAAFVDFGRGRNGILYANEITYTDEDFEGEIPRIEKALKPGQRILVQVTKDPIGTKGSRLTTQVALAGRYLVLAPDQQAAGVSRRLSDRERLRLRKILKELAPPDTHGVIIRTAADGASHEAIAADLGTLLKNWEQISKKAKGAKAPSALYEEPELIMRIVRDIFADDFEKVVCDTRSVFDEIRGHLEEAAPDLVDKVHLHEGALPLLEEHRVAEQLTKALERKVWLPSGGSLVFDRTEAMTVVDVNTGKFTGKGGNLEDTVFKNNCEAAEEIARQLRLRDIGGIIIIDFIDMIDPKNQREVLKTLKQALGQDRTKSQVFEVSNLGLVEMTRKRVSEGLVEAFSESCPNCEGRGLVVDRSMS